jgi:hypothetical protein
MLEQKMRTARVASDLEALCEPLRALGWKRLETDWSNQS